MRVALFVAVVSIAGCNGGAAGAAQDCAIAGAAYGDGAALCQPAVRDGRVEQMLFVCEDGSWNNTEARCPEAFAYFCRIGPYSVPVGDTLLLGAGPAVLECAFPGVLKLNQDAAPVSPAEAPALPSVTVRNVQHYLSDEGAGIDCARDPCDGRADARTLAAVVRFVRDNFGSLSAAEQMELGASSASEVEAALLARSPIDVIPAFARIFDVPAAQ
jgi:hypothetical protein